MHDVLRALATAVALVGTFDSELLAIVALSLRVSLSATIIAMMVGAPLAGALAITRFPGQQLIVVLANAMLGLPPVVVGLAIYLLKRGRVFAIRPCKSRGRLAASDALPR